MLDALPAPLPHSLNGAELAAHAALLSEGEHLRIGGSDTVNGRSADSDGSDEDHLLSYLSFLSSESVSWGSDILNLEMWANRTF